MDIGNSFGLTQTYLPEHIIAIRLIIAALCGAVIGFEREVRTAEAGLRTHILIAAAAALFTILTFEIFHTIDVGGGAGSRADPIRAVEAVTAGIAFLGAGAIFRSGASVQGLTTGAGMWMAGAVGVACALGFYTLAAGTTILAVLVLAAMRALAHRFIGHKAEEDDEAEKRRAEELGRGEKHDR
jgi:putative Mg2+ transporter-C (MgtC) family protein